MRFGLSRTGCVRVVFTVVALALGGSLSPANLFEVKALWLLLLENKTLRLNIYFCSDMKSLQLLVLFDYFNLRLIKPRKKLRILEIPCWRAWSDKLLLAALQIGLDCSCCLLPCPCCCVWFALVNGLWAYVTTGVKNFRVKITHRRVYCCWC